MTAKLYIVATPIGNLNDITLRALDVLKKVDMVAAEDTRRTRQLLNHFEIDNKVVPCHDHSNAARLEQIVTDVESGLSVALVSDAGTPLISDPGYELVRLARQRGVEVVPCPGPSAVVTALSAAGLPSDRFSFEGFLPAKSQKRVNVLKEVIRDPRTLIYYEAPHRILDSLKDMSMVFGSDREACVARELTKSFETITSSTLGQLVEFTESDSNQQRGELVVMIAPDKSDVGISSEVIKAYQLLAEELPPKKAAKIVSELYGVKAKEIYQLGLTIK